eukprot:scaffold466599_cov27-Prasinocladus_malaysianus.AAC.1
MSCNGLGLANRWYSFGRPETAEMTSCAYYFPSTAMEPPKCFQCAGNFAMGGAYIYKICDSTRLNRAIADHTRQPQRETADMHEEIDWTTMIYIIQQAPSDILPFNSPASRHRTYACVVWACCLISHRTR